mgnify:CR=1 FL=1
MDIIQTGDDMNWQFIVSFLIQWTWGFMQNISGLCMAILWRQKDWHIYKNAIVTHYTNRRKAKQGYFAVGMFIFTDDQLPEATYNKVLSHEYGHTVQSMILGPFFPLLVGLPSMLRFRYFNFMKKRGKKPVEKYSVKYPENWANRLGEKATGKKPIDW